MQVTGLRRIGAAVGAALASVAAVAALAPSGGQADTTNPSWNCRGSVAYALTNLGIDQIKRIEPFAANGNPTNADAPDRPVCADDSQAVPHVNLPPQSPIKLDADAVKAQTDITPDIGAARDQTASSVVTATNVDINLGGTPIHLDAVNASASVKCVNGVPTPTTRSSVAGLEIAGNKVPLQDGVVQIKTVIDGLPLQQLIRVSINDPVTPAGDASSPIQVWGVQALRVELLPMGGKPTAALILGEAKVSRQGNTCAPADTTPTTTTGTGPTTGTGTGTGTGTVTVTTPGGQTSPSIVYVPIPGDGGTTTGSGTGEPTTIELNGQNGGCGKLTMYFSVPKKPKVLGSVYGNRVVTRGRIISCGGKPIVGGRIDVYHVLKGRKTRIKKTGIRSRPGGLLTLILPLNLTTRKIVFEYRGNLASTKITSKQTLSLIVRYKGKVITKEPGPVRKVDF